MFQIGIKEYADILHKVYSLASEKRPKNEAVCVGTVDLEDILRKREESELLKYLYSLDLETIQVIEAVMYIGRDYSPLDDPEIRAMLENANDEVDYKGIVEIESIVPVHNPNKLVNDTLDQLKSNAAFGNKDISINQIYQKTPLRNYLDRAFRILGL